MTAKRFTKDDTLMFSAIKDNGKPMKVKEVVDLLNTFHEENIKYKQELEQYENIVNLTIYVDTGKKPTMKEIIEQMINQEPLISDEEAFLRHLIRKWEE